ncbi:MarC family protein [Stenotrophomonas sp.]|uniref:MarC family protein n=1 Tax=Stenotrophomonas sp. TaxID=69392 RepID=UPI0028999B34|nr:MarC family protein [Stenotrophomonas sp.]
MTEVDAVMPVPPIGAPEAVAYVLALSEVFVLFFITMGPVKSLGDYAVRTSGLTVRDRRALAVRVFGVSAIAVLAAGLVGGTLLKNWHVSPHVLQAAGGLVFLLVALRLLLSQYISTVPAPGTPAAEVSAAELAFPVTVPAYAIAAVIVMVAMSHEVSRTAAVLGVAVVVLLLDALVLAYIQRIVNTLGTLTLSIIGAIMGVMQVALALQLIIAAARAFLST